MLDSFLSNARQRVFSSNPAESDDCSGASSDSESELEYVFRVRVSTRKVRKRPSAVDSEVDSELREQGPREVEVVL